jgi:membrane-associated protease RseP (regulator of RpoE activity)
MSASPAVRRPWLNGLLFGLTVLTTWFAGTIFAASFVSADTTGQGLSFLEPRVVVLGFLYTLSLMIILVGHELGHYLTCRRYGVPATYPYLLPGLVLPLAGPLVPIPVFGTFGAFIRIKSHLPYRHQVFDIGINGPLAGFALTIPILVVGLALSKAGPLAPSGEALHYGVPLLFGLLSRLFVGPIPDGSELIWHPIGWAGWVGLLVTALNLLPIGQLDGGHVAYALLGRRAWKLSRVMIVVLVILGIFFAASWLLPAAILFVLQFKWKAILSHPPVFDESAPLGRRRAILSGVILLVFVLSFIPEPIQDYSLLDLLNGSASLR